MNGFGNPDLLADEEVGKAAPSNANLHSLALSWEEMYSVANSTMGIQLNRQQCGQRGGTSTEVQIQQGSTYSAPQGSDTNNLLRTGDPITIIDRTSRKRKTDRRYREKLKLDKLQMETDMDFLHVENKNLKKENERLQCEHVSMNGTLQAQEKLIDQLKFQHDKLNDEYKKQNVLVHRLSELLAPGPDLQLENKRLKLENDQLRHNARLDYNMVLADENVKLKLENKLLRVQNDALCGKLISDSDKKHA